MPIVAVQILRLFQVSAGITAGCLAIVRDSLAFLRNKGDFTMQSSSGGNAVFFVNSNTRMTIARDAAVHTALIKLSAGDAQRLIDASQAPVAA
jgi:hypothetical protein